MVFSTFFLFTFSVTLLHPLTCSKSLGCLWSCLIFFCLESWIFPLIYLNSISIVNSTSPEKPEYITLTTHWTNFLFQLNYLMWSVGTGKGERPSHFFITFTCAQEVFMHKRIQGWVILLAQHHIQNAHAQKWYNSILQYFTVLFSQHF